MTAMELNSAQSFRRRGGMSIPDKEKDYSEIPATAEYAEVRAGEDGVTEETLKNLSNNRGEE